MKQTLAPNKTSRRQPYRPLRWLAPILVMACIFYFSSRTGDDLGAMLPWFQRWLPFMTGFDWGHLVAYFLLALSFEYAFGQRSTRPAVKLLIIVLCVLYGITDEYHQSFVGGRTPDIHDLVNDAIGAAAAVGLTALSPVRRLWAALLK
ncbi:VanZ family protein [Paenibacillus tarimensis]|uniref:VanZ family protein n=1 Tax=Paenibacillus tarimensis TaxID=416012 RepID=UPI001F3F1667|nr:VanZ family protein [Paenibacillus tarimensis]MCF2942183.1 VanZ family protein [Paenibacillus tarimensis]